MLWGVLSVLQMIRVNRCAEKSSKRLSSHGNILWLLVLLGSQSGMRSGSTGPDSLQSRAKGRYLMTHLRFFVCFCVLSVLSLQTFCFKPGSQYRNGSDSVDRMDDSGLATSCLFLTGLLWMPEFSVSCVYWFCFCSLYHQQLPLALDGQGSKFIPRLSGLWIQFIGDSMSFGCG